MASVVVSDNLPDALGHFGPYGGRFVPETLMPALQELEDEFDRSRNDAEFQKELEYYFTEYAGRPTPLTFAARMTEDLGGAKIYLKREDLLHTGAHKINNAIGQALLATKLGKKRIIAETGAGRRGGCAGSAGGSLSVPPFECVFLRMEPCVGGTA